MKRPLPLLAFLALGQLAVPAPAVAAAVVVPLCAGGAMPLPIPVKDKENSPCCGKLCHVNERKRSSGQCCGPEDETDDA